MIELLETRVAASVTAMEKILIDDVNQYRTQAGERALIVDERLMKTSRQYSADLMAAQQIQHELNGTLPSDRAARNGFRAAMILENALLHYTIRVEWDLPGVLHEHIIMFANHPGHREQLYSTETTMIGVGYTVGWFGNSMAIIDVQMYASTPTRPATPFRPQLVLNPDTILE